MDTFDIAGLTQAQHAAYLAAYKEGYTAGFRDALMKAAKIISGEEPLPTGESNERTS